MPQAYNRVTAGKQQALSRPGGLRQTVPMADEKRSLISATLITQIEGFIQRNGRDHDAFVVGIAEDADAALAAHGVNKSKHVCISLNALTDERAEGITQHFAKKGCTIGETAGSGVVYCYRKAFNTNP
jgi:hypothetical protein